MSLFESVKEYYDLAAHVEDDIGPPAKRSGKWLYWLCPFHDEKTASFAVNTANHTAFCFGGCGFNGSIIDYHQRRNRLPDALAAAKDLAALAGLTPEDCNGNTRPPEPKRKRIPPPAGVNVHTEPPPIQWQAQARAALIDVLCPALWGPEGGPARAWLKARGIDESAMARYSLGYTPGGEVGGIQFAMGRGIVIPHYHYYQGTETLYTLKIRRPVPPGTANKYYCATGSKPGASLYNADSLAGKDTCFVVEGELDTICLYSQIDGLAAVITLGSKDARIADYWLPHLLHVKRFLIATDANEDEAAAKYWLDLVGNRGERVLPPGGCKDVSEAAGNGYSLRQWALDTMKGFA